MSWNKYRREAFLTAMVGVSLAIIAASNYFFSAELGLGVIAAGVFVSVLGVGFYDQWQDAELAKATVKARSKTRR